MPTPCDSISPNLRRSDTGLARLASIDMEMDKSKESYRPLPPTSFSVHEEASGKQKRIVLKIPLIWSLREVQKHVASVWRSYEAKEKQGERFFPYSKLDRTTRQLRKVHGQVKSKYRSATQKPRRRQRSKALHQWLWNQFDEMKTHNSKITRREAARILTDRLEDHNLNLSAESGESFPCLSGNTIRKILSQK